VSDARVSPTTAPTLPVRAIGVVRCAVTEGRDEDWGDVVSELHLDDALARGLDGVDGFSHVLVVYWMHEASFDAARDLVRRPRGRADMPALGIFAQRAKHRPNPIGVTAVRVVGRDSAVLRVRGLDAIDGTPILDLKPYFPEFDRIDAPVVPAWATELMRGYFSPAK
jgi:tRNA-Thr(GGU) m(6)t(6)A37 methyltransferase TsaA